MTSVYNHHLNFDWSKKYTPDLLINDFFKSWSCCTTSMFLESAPINTKRFFETIREHISKNPLSFVDTLDHCKELNQSVKWFIKHNEIKDLEEFNDRVLLLFKLQVLK